jgi:hypothetical protein
MIDMPLVQWRAEIRHDEFISEWTGGGPQWNHPREGYGSFRNRFFHLDETSALAPGTSEDRV